MPRAKKNTVVEETVKDNTIQEEVTQEDREQEEILEQAETEHSKDKAASKPKTRKKTKIMEDDVSQAPARTRKDVINEMVTNERTRAARNDKRETTLMSWEQLRGAHKDGRIVTGSIFSIETLDNKHVVAVVDMTGFRVIIPIEEMYKNPPLDYSTVVNEAQRIHRERQMLSKLLGGEIQFIITNIDGSPSDNEDGYLIVGSRRQALARIEERNYIRHSRNGMPAITEGSVAEATVVSVGQHAVFANVGGVDTSISTYQLTYRYVDNATNMYTLGDKFNVVVKSIEFDEDGSVKNLVVSGKEAEIEEYQSRIDKIKPNTLTLGVITSVRASKKTPGKTIITLFIDAYKMPAMASYVKIDTMAEPPKTGDRVVFSTYMVTDRGFVMGQILRKA